MRMLPPSARLGKRWTEYSVGKIPHHPVSNGLVRFRYSKNWFDARFRKEQYAVPFIDHKGHIHATPVGVWVCRPSDLFATICSTVSKRLYALNRRLKRKKRCPPDLLFRIALLYSIDNNDSWFRRCRAMITSNRSRQLRRFVYRYEKHLDANRRFLYDQAQSRALWFQSRVRRCERRDQSKFDKATQKRLNTIGLGVKGSDDYNLVSWCSVYRTSRNYGPVETINSLFKSSSIFRGKS